LSTATFDLGINTRAAMSCNKMRKRNRISITMLRVCTWDGCSTRFAHLLIVNPKECRRRESSGTKRKRCSACNAFYLPLL